MFPTHDQIRRAARELLKLEDKDPKRLFEGNALIRRLVRIGVLDDSRMRLDYVLALKTEDFLERRLQTQVFKLGYVDFGDGHANHTDIQTRQVCPPRPCPHQAEAHSSRQADRQRPIFRCPTRLPKVSPSGLLYHTATNPQARRLRIELSLRWWTTRSSQEEEGQGRRWW